MELAHRHGDAVDFIFVEATIADLDGVSGPSWQKQFREERRVDPEDGEARTLMEMYRTYRRDYTRQEIVTYWDTLEVFKPVPAAKEAAK